MSYTGILNNNSTMRSQAGSAPVCQSALVGELFESISAFRLEPGDENTCDVQSYQSYQHFILSWGC